MADFTMELDDDYDVLRVEIDGQLNILSEVLDGMKRRTNRFDLAIVAAPDSAFDPKDQVILDPIHHERWARSLAHRSVADQSGQPCSQSNDHGHLQGFGHFQTNSVSIRSAIQSQPGGRRTMRAHVVMDAGSPTGTNVTCRSSTGSSHPVAIAQGVNHPITTNLDPIHFDFASSLDTVDAPGKLRKTVLLSSSERSREYKSPVRVSSSIVELTPRIFLPKLQAPSAIGLAGRGILSGPRFSTDCRRFLRMTRSLPLHLKACQPLKFSSVTAIWHATR